MLGLAFKAKGVMDRSEERRRRKRLRLVNKWVIRYKGKKIAEIKTVFDARSKEFKTVLAGVDGSIIEGDQTDDPQLQELMEKMNLDDLG